MSVSIFGINSKIAIIIKLVYNNIRQINWLTTQSIDDMKYTRITVNPEQMAGVPCIRNLRIPVATVVGMIAAGMSHQEILEAYPDLVKDDISESLLYAAEAVKEREIPLVEIW